MDRVGLSSGRGNESDYVLGTELEGWTGLRVVRWRAVEALGRPFEIEVTAMRPREAGALDLQAFVDRGATLRIATETRWRPIHGVVASAEELERTNAIHLYRFVVVPHAFRMSRRVRYRTFVDRTLREILVALLENRTTAHPTGVGGLALQAAAPEPPSPRPSFASYAPPAPRYRFAVAQTERLDDPGLRSYVVQYGESDLDLLHRLLEEEGLTYFFEHADDAVVLTIVDRPGQVSPFAREDRCVLRSDPRGTGVAEKETVRSLKVARRLAWGSTMAREWDPARPLAPLTALAIDDDSPDTFANDVYPSRDPSVAEPCIVPALLSVERRRAEGHRRVGRSNVRRLEPGLKVVLSDDAGVYDDQSIVVTAVRTFATQLEPEATVLDDEPWGLNGRGHAGPTYENEFAALPDDVPFRPELSTAAPRIHGVHTAVVSAEEVVGETPEIHRDEQSRVRLRFPWDERLEPGRPSSCWVRVSQGWAGAGYGQLFVPRVGQEVLVAYLGGDPERPMVVGRVYNAIQPVPYEKPTISSIKSKSSPDSDGFNEIRFDDEAGNEEVFLHAQKNLNETVLASHATSVGGDQSNSVGGNQSNSVKGSRTHGVDGDESNRIDGDRTTHVGTNETYSISGQLRTSIGTNEKRSVDGFRNTLIGANDDLKIVGWRNTLVGTGENREVLGPDRLNVSGDKTTNVRGAFSMHSDTRHRLDAPEFVADGGGATITLTGGVATISSGAGASISLAGNTIILSATNILSTSAAGTKLTAGANIEAVAAVIKLNG